MKKIIACIALISALSANAQTYPITIRTANISETVIKGNPTIVKTNDTVLTISNVTPSDTATVTFTFPIASLPATTAVGGAIAVMPVQGTGTAQTALVGNLEYSTNGVDFHPSVRTMLKQTTSTGYAFGYNVAYSIPQTATVVRFTYISEYGNTLRFRIDEYLSMYLPKKELWYNFGDMAGEFGFINKHYDQEGTGVSDIHFFETGGLSENFATRKIATFDANDVAYYFSGFQSITQVEDLNRTGHPDIAIGNSVLKSRPDGSYTLIPQGAIIPNLDINRDGRLDYLYADNDRQIIAYQQPNGRFSDAFIDRMSFDEYNQTEIIEEDEWVYSVNPNNLIQGKSLPPNTMFPIRGGVLESTHTAAPTTATQFATAFADLNKDGIPDMLSPERGMVY
ncbi:MAG: VCBS repeat-containing protein, partial [Bacteroidales bacterium]|nr:VCBS repeat-containing protein [Bacteroidales bacterium]